MEPENLWRSGENEFTAVVETADEGSYFAYCPEVPEANQQVETREEALQNLREAISLVLEARSQRG